MMKKTALMMFAALLIGGALLVPTVMAANDGTSVNSAMSGDCDQLKEQDRDQLNDGVCTGDCDQLRQQNRTRLHDGTCLCDGEGARLMNHGETANNMVQECAQTMSGDAYQNGNMVQTQSQTQKQMGKA